MLFLLSDELSFPPVDYADENGLLAVGGDLSCERLLLAYKSGIFPWHDEPPMWYSPDPRMILDLENYKPSKSLLRRIKRGEFELKYDKAFAAVIRSCSMLRDDTWISEEFIDSYSKLHEMGVAHSIEAYKDGELVGGLYGLAIGDAFFGESMFHTSTDASKVTFHYLVRQVQQWGFTLLDCQINNDHLLSLGGVDIDRDEYIEMLRLALLKSRKNESWAKYSPQDVFV
ncbi:leucyl/phenylalanyl-tRNA--protein transferase [Lentisphaera profundi]|uniref:Leucyl/phenylalanyl-tRNA--protein transferase n=1 Tax=Lentisphaera profundi TaxID=1658616 RepID=A0ABY7VRI8_9BACT|nr:leucyl/phenylalanyl-tRNA--protein transferase [Lentisphaera profundi]WDE96810.1 leucyl/phenylalanyl-tRNA--protein transferase [Lentisphaera profundi]